MTLYSSILVFLMYLAAGSTLRTIDIDSIAGKSKNDIESILGPVTGEDFNIFPNNSKCKCRRVLFTEGKIAITFFNGKADWIWIDRSITVTGIETARIRQFHKFNDFVFIKVFTNDNRACCSDSI
jgi:hypothetical protein